MEPTGLTSEECAVVVGITPGAWRDRVRRGRAPAPRGYCPQTGRRVWDPAQVFAYRSGWRAPSPEPRYAGRVTGGDIVVEILDWRAPQPSNRGGFPPYAWQARRSAG